MCAIGEVLQILQEEFGEVNNDLLNDVYGDAEYVDGFICFSDEDTGNGYKVAVCTTT